LTIALGIRTGEGILCCTDSMRVDWSTPRPTVELGGSKHERLCDRLYYLVSGYFSSGAPLLGDVDEGKLDHLAVDELAPLMWDEVVSRMVPAMGTHDGLQRPAALLVAGGPKGQMPGLTLYRTNRQPMEASGDVLVSGAITEWAEEHGVPGVAAPATLDAAVDLAEGWCRSYLTDSYRGWGIEELLDPAALRREVSRPGGAIPPSAFPLHLVAITADEVTELEIAR
jgi:hypothetical protein